MSNVYEVSQQALDAIPTAGEVFPEGRYKIRLVGFAPDANGSIVRTNRAGQPFIMPILTIIGEKSQSRDIYEYLGLPTVPDTNDPKALRKSARIKADYIAFCSQVGANPTSVDFTKLIGAEFYAYVGVTEDDWGIKNELLSWGTTPPVQAKRSSRVTQAPQPPVDIPF